MAGCTDTSEDPEIGADVEDVTQGPLDEGVFGDPELFLGDEVTVSAEVNEVLSEESFLLAGGDLPDLLVISAEGPTEVAVDTTARVTGEIVDFVVADIEAGFGLDLDDELYLDYEQEHAIVAESVTIIEEDA